MNVVCEACGETVEVEFFHLIDDGVVFTCPDCGEKNGADVAREKEESEEPSEGDDPDQSDEHLLEVKCPKCFLRQATKGDCPRCGLNLNKATQEEHAWDVYPDEKAAEYEQALNLWSNVEAEPGSEKGHQIFVEHCSENGLLETAARRYRSRRADHSGESLTDAYFKTTVERLEALALASLGADQWSEKFDHKIKVVKRVLLMISILFFIVGMVILVLIWRKNQEVLPPGL